jgi:hypothetical protein
MFKHNKGKEVFSKDMSIGIPLMMIFIGASLSKTTLGSTSCHKLNNCNVEFQFRIFFKKLLKVRFSVVSHLL